MATDDADGAVAAAVYFVSDLYSYSYAAGDVDEFRSLSADDCSFCNSVIDDIESFTAAKQTDTGSQIEVKSSRGVAVDPDGSLYSVWVDIEQSPSQRFEASGDLVGEDAGGSYPLFIAIEWQDGWKIRGLDILPAESGT